MEDKIHIDRLQFEGYLHKYLKYLEDGTKFVLLMDFDILQYIIDNAETMKYDDKFVNIMSSTNISFYDKKDYVVDYYKKHFREITNNDSFYVDFTNVNNNYHCPCILCTRQRIYGEREKVVPYAI